MWERCSEAACALEPKHRAGCRAAAFNRFQNTRQCGRAHAPSVLVEVLNFCPAISRMQYCNHSEGACMWFSQWAGDLLAWHARGARCGACASFRYFVCFWARCGGCAARDTHASICWCRWPLAPAQRPGAGAAAKAVKPTSPLFCQSPLLTGSCLPIDSTSFRATAQHSVGQWRLKAGSRPSLCGQRSGTAARPQRLCAGVCARTPCARAAATPSQQAARSAPGPHHVLSARLPSVPGL